MKRGAIFFLGDKSRGQQIGKTKAPRTARLLTVLLATILLFAFFAVFSFRRPTSQVPLHARVICAEGTLNPDGTLMNRGWRVAVTKPNEQSRFWHWSVWMQETNREPNRVYPPIPLKKDSIDFDVVPELAHEHGILLGNGFGLIQPGKVYRVIGAHTEPGVQHKLPTWTRHLPPRILKLIPAGKPRFATSEWYEIAIAQPPARIDAEASLLNQ